jgi:26S proteasome regulatory subunit T1
MPPRADWEKYKKGDEDQKDEEKIVALDEGDIQLLKTYGQGPYAQRLKSIENELKEVQKRVNERMGVKESDTGLAPPNLWDLAADRQRMAQEQPLQVARCTKIIKADSGKGKENGQEGQAQQQNGGSGSESSSEGGEGGNGEGDRTGGLAGALGGLGGLSRAFGGGPGAEEEDKYVINVKQIAKFVVGLGDRVAPTDIEEGMRVGVDRTKYQIQIPLPPKIDPSVTMMQVEEKPDVTYGDVGGCKEQIEKLREVVETPLLAPEKFVNLGIDPPKGVLLYGPPGTGKTLSARAVANRTDATFIRVIGSELVQKYVGEGARMVRELFEMARTKKACIIFFDEVDAIGGARFDDGAGGDNEVQRTMLELINQLDGFDPRGNIKVLMATNRPDTLDPALLRPGRLDRKVEFGLPDNEGRAHILRIHARSMSVEKDIRFDLIARLCPNTTGAELRSVATEAGMFAIRARRKMATEKDFLEAVEKVVRAGQKFSSTGLYSNYN